MLASCSDITQPKAAGPVSAPLEPPVFTSSNHLLDLLVITRPETITLGSFQPTASVFEMCQRADADGDTCPADSRTVAPYGGIRLQLSPGDHLRMRLINQLPPARPTPKTPTAPTR